MPSYDIAIVGAGPAGSSCATLLSRAGLRVALIDRAAFPRDKICGDGITPRGARALGRLGILPKVMQVAQPNRGVTIRGGTGRSFTIGFDRDPEGPSDLLVIPRLVLDSLLLEHAQKAGADFMAEVKVTEVRSSAADTAEIVDAQGGVVTARLAVLATGAESQLLRASGLLPGKPQLEHAARAYFDDVDGLDENVTLFFDGVDMPGYGWIFPTGPRSANIGCGVFDRGGMRQAQRLAELIAHHPLLAPMLARATQREPIRTYPLRTDFRPEFAGRAPRVCVGEAAGLVNPITGEGIDYALESAEFLAAAVGARWRRDAGAIHAVVEDYRRRLRRRFALRFGVYRWIQQHCLTGANTAEFLDLVETSPDLRRALVDGLFGRSRLSTYVRPQVLGPGLRMALGKRRVKHPSGADAL
jgi:geranylgeranyl reductase family protein